jgi:hypothetical protein
MRYTKIMVVAATLLALPAWAQNTPMIDQHQANQQKRIAQGQAAGTLTPDEAARLQNGQAKIASKKTHAAADGKVTATERAHIRKAQKRQSKRIYSKKHN